MDTNRLLHFAIEKKLKELPTSDKVLQELLKSEPKVKDIFNSKGLGTRLTALCDLLTILILAIDQNQRQNIKPKVEATDKVILDGDKQIGSKNEENDLEIMEVDSQLLDSLVKDFNTQKHCYFLSGQA